MIRAGSRLARRAAVDRYAVTHRQAVASSQRDPHPLPGLDDPAEPFGDAIREDLVERAVEDHPHEPVPLGSRFVGGEPEPRRLMLGGSTARFGPPPLCIRAFLITAGVDKTHGFYYTGFMHVCPHGIVMDECERVPCQSCSEKLESRL